MQSLSLQFCFLFLRNYIPLIMRAKRGTWILKPIRMTEITCFSYAPCERTRNVTTRFAWPALLQPRPEYLCYRQVTGFIEMICV